jgi:hypothetical protein
MTLVMIALGFIAFCIMGACGMSALIALIVALVATVIAVSVYNGCLS